MSIKANNVILELNRINSELEQVFTTFEIHKEVDLDPFQRRFKELSSYVQDNKEDHSSETFKSLAEVEKSLNKISAVMINYQKILETQLNQVNDNKTAFKTYISSMYLES